jgi:Xaa-Pro dipeptidase
MAEQEIDCVLATSYVASYYLSGVPIHSFGRPLATLIPLEGEAAIVESIIEQGHTEAQSWIRDIRTYHDYNIDPVYGNPQSPLASMVQLVQGALADRGLESGRIGIEEGHLPVGHLQALQSALPGAEFVSVTSTLDRLRMVLSEEELRLTRQADAVADLGQETLINILKPGKSAYELTTHVKKIMTEEILKEHPDKPFRIHAGCGLGSGAKSAGHSEWTTWNLENRVQESQLLETVMSVWLWGYWGNVERAVYVGDPTPGVRRAFEVMVEANEAAISVTRPGVLLADVDRACKQVFAKHGYTTRTGSGCGRGITSYEGNARELMMDLRLYSDVVLEPGMAFSLEPDLHVPGIGVYRHCNTIIVTDKGCEVDSRLSRGVIWVE